MKEIQSLVSLWDQERPLTQQVDTPHRIHGKFLDESKELTQEMTQWEQGTTPSPDLMQRIQDEMADCVVMLARLANLCGINLEDAVTEKLAKDEVRLPPELFQEGEGIFFDSVYSARKVELGEWTSIPGEIIMQSEQEYTL